MNERRNRYERRYSDRARAITKAKARKQNVIIASTAVALVAVVAASFLLAGAFNMKPRTAGTAPTAAVVKVADKDLAAQKSAQPAASGPVAQPNDIRQTTVDTDAYADAAAYTQPVAQETQQSEDRIEYLNGERVYIDTKRTAPTGTGEPLHYYAYGKTSYGFDWTYDTDNCNFVVACNYNFDQQQYDFILYGVTPGVSNVTLYYNTDDGVQAPAYITINVDDNLNVSFA